VDDRGRTQGMNGLDGLRGQGRLTWIDAEQGWVGSG
jgi:hypothetical protein